MTGFPVRTAVVVALIAGTLSVFLWSADMPVWVTVAIPLLLLIGEWPEWLASKIEHPQHNDVPEVSGREPDAQQKLEAQESGVIQLGTWVAERKKASGAESDPVAPVAKLPVPVGHVYVSQQPCLHHDARATGGGDRDGAVDISDATAASDLGPAPDAMSVPVPEATAELEEPGVPAPGTATIQFERLPDEVQKPEF